MRLLVFPALFVISACAQPSAQEPATHLVAGAQCEGEGPLIYVAGALRNDGDGWKAVSDSEHTPINIASVATRDGMIEVNYTFKANRVVSLVAAPDEALTKNGYSAGASVGINKARIVLSRGRAVDPWSVNTKEIPWSNLWLYGVFKGRCA